MAAALTIAPISATQPFDLPPLAGVTLHTEPVSEDLEQLECSFTDHQIALLEKLNRADREHLVQLEQIVVPDRWDLDELAYSPLPAFYLPAGEFPKIIVVYQPAQVFGAYQRGELMRWGPVSSGGKSTPTPAGLFHLTWKSTFHRSTLNRNWLLPWYFNFHNKRGHSFHQYELPGRPASHGCVRLLERDALWLYEWGEQWELGPRGWTVKKRGTPVLIVGNYDHHRPAMWRAADYLDAGGRLSLVEQELSVTLTQLIPDQNKTARESSSDADD